MMPMWASNDAMRIMEPEETGKITVRERACSFGCMFLATILHGVGSGMVGIFIAHLIRTVQIVGFGHDHGGFLEIALESNPWRRMACVIGGGLIGSAAWFWLRGRSTYLVTVEESLKGAKMPPAATVMNAMVQDVVVALGGSFGREAAPREIAAMWGGWVGDAFRVSTEQRKILVACGAGAGLAAVYSVPISGALYTIEHVLNWDISLAAVLPAITTSVVATLVTSTTVETHGLYSMPRFSYEWPTWDVCLFALLVGPVAGLGAACFRRFIKFVEGYKPLGRVPVDFQNVKVNDEVWVSRDKEGYIYRVKVRILHTVKNTDGTGSITSVVVRTAAESDEEYGEEEYMNEEDWFEAHAEGPRDWTIFVFMPLAFLVLALLSRYYPSLLGNGRALAEIAMQRKRSTFLLGMLLLLKALMTAAAIGSGAAGGTLTPSVALGATLGAIVGESYQYYLPDWAPAEDQDSRMSVVAAAAFLAVAMNSPVTGLWLLMEFAAQGVGFEDLIALVQGDGHGVVASKMALGMLVPMTLGVLCATQSVKLAGCIWNWTQPVQQLETPPDKDYKPITRVTVTSDVELAEMTTQSSYNGGEPDETKLDKERSNSSVLSLSLDGELVKPPSKVGRKTLRSTSTSVDLDLPELHESIGSRNYRRNRSFSADSSSVLLRKWMS